MTCQPNPRDSSTGRRKSFNDFMPQDSRRRAGITTIVRNQRLRGFSGRHHGHGKGHDKHHDDDDRDEHNSYRYDYHEQAIRGWYSTSENHLPPGLAKKDRLPPGLEKQLVRN